MGWSTSWPSGPQCRLLPEKSGWIAKEVTAKKSGRQAEKVFVNKEANVFSQISCKFKGPVRCRLLLSDQTANLSSQLHTRCLLTLHLAQRRARR